MNIILMDKDVIIFFRLMDQIRCSNKFRLFLVFFWGGVKTLIFGHLRCQDLVLNTHRKLSNFES